MLRRMFLIATLALLFGLGQQGAAVHAISHLADWQARQHDQTLPDADQSCEQCVAYAKLSAALGSPGLQPASPCLALFSQPPARHSVAGTTATGYAARAPPAHA